MWNLNEEVCHEWNLDASNFENLLGTSYTAFAGYVEDIAGCKVTVAAT